VKIVGVTPKLGVSIQGLRNPREPNPTRLFRQDAFDEVIEIDEQSREESFRIAGDLARKEGLLVGMSSAAIMLVALRKAKELGEGKVVVAVLPDSGLKHLSPELFV